MGGKKISKYYFSKLGIFKALLDHV